MFTTIVYADKTGKCYAETHLTAEASIKASNVHRQGGSLYSMFHRETLTEAQAVRDAYRQAIDAGTFYACDDGESFVDPLWPIS